MSIPAVKLFKDGKIVDEFTGAQPEATIKQWLDQKL
jgi:putative thioredoxin